MKGRGSEHQIVFHNCTYETENNNVVQLNSEWNRAKMFLSHCCIYHTYPIYILKSLIVNWILTTDSIANYTQFNTETLKLLPQRSSVETIWSWRKQAMFFATIIPSLTCMSILTTTVTRGASHYDISVKRVEKKVWSIIQQMIFTKCVTRKKVVDESMVEAFKTIALKK